MWWGDNVPGSGATSFGAALIGASKSTCVGSSNEGAILEIFYALQACRAVGN